jgi:hypothetical protein
VINTCFGGFSLSEEAVARCIESGMAVTEIGEKGQLIDGEAYFYLNPRYDSSTPDSFMNNKYYTSNDHASEFRSNPVVIQVVKELGKKANGACAKLKIINIPFDGIQGWYIDDYDGQESIKQEYASWS